MLFFSARALEDGFESPLLTSPALTMSQSENIVLHHYENHTIIVNLNVYHLETVKIFKLQMTYVSLGYISFT